MVSMTGFAFGEAGLGSVRLTAELKSYNNRYLDLVLSLPPSLASWEPAVREQLGAAVARGRVEFTLRLKETSETAAEVNLDLARAYLAAVETLRQGTGVRGDLSLDRLAMLPGVLGGVREQDPALLRSGAETLLARLLSDFQTARSVEGGRLEADIRRQLAVISAGRAAIASRSAEMEPVFRENLKRKLTELAADVDEQRLVAETALLVVRYGINEELVRLESHEQSFRALLTESQPVGKKLDFLCQELGREINTIGSKTTFAEVQHQVVAMKDALENMREQLRNVE
jgi:uncharacterized protein (TIGR00255 family)